MLTALGLRGFVMQIYTGSGVGCVEGVRQGEGGGVRRGSHTSGVQKSAIAKHLKATFARRERIKWQSAQKLLQNIRITEMFLLCCDIVALSISISLSFICIFSLEFSGVLQFTFSHSQLPFPSHPRLLKLECALNFISVHGTLTNYFDK